MTGGLRGILLVVGYWILSHQTAASPIINELLANEPGRYTSLEWIELYNDSDSAFSLAGCRLDVNGIAVALPDSLTLDSGSYLVVCRRLFAEGDSPGFESYWGNNSGVWGDCAEESAIDTPVEASFSLTNESGVAILYVDDRPSSALEWTEAGFDGYSWERLAAGTEDIYQCIDFSGSTPGFLNSVTPVARDLSLDTVSIVVSWEMGAVLCGISNRGLDTVTDALVCLLSLDSLFGSVIDTLEVVSVPMTASGHVVTVEIDFPFPTIAVPVAVVLSDDDRNRNNRRDLFIPGSERSLMLSELMANPESPLETEWLELFNSADTGVNLIGWSFGDNLHAYPITGDTLIVEPGGYVVLVQSLIDFNLFYPDDGLRCFQPNGWPAFNDDGDCVRLVDPRGATVDIFAYDHTYDDNYTWVRGETGSTDPSWGRSVESGGSPGRSNSVLFEPDAAGLSVKVEPAYLSPDGDGIDDFITVSLEAPPADDFTVRIYDRQGRPVKTLYDREPLIPQEFRWDGLSDAGQRLPVGIYILYVEASGVASSKTPIVIAR